MALQIFDFEQGTPEWKAARLGVITASNFKKVLTKGIGWQESKTRRGYMLELATEIIRGEAASSFGNYHTERGSEYEPVAAELYTLQTGNAIIPCGFIRNDEGFGYSPDGLVGDDGLIEIKTKLAGLHAAVLLGDTVPKDHVDQVQGGLYVTGRQWVDFVSYCPGLPLFIKRVERDDDYILALEQELKMFKDELDEVVKRIIELF